MSQLEGVSLIPVERVYRRLAPFYDLIYGVTLQPGRRRAMERLAPMPGESVLEVGVGTGWGLLNYPRGCRVVAVDLSSSMLQRAHNRLRRHAIDHVALCRMDAGRLAFGDSSFDAVYAPYLINVVPNPVTVVREMLRVCRSGGRLVLLNHFDHIHSDCRSDGVTSVVGNLATGVSGVNWHLDLREFLRETGLTPESVEPVNALRVSSVVLCRKA